MLFWTFLHILLNLWPIFTFYTAIESYGHVDYTCFIHFEKSQKMKALGHKNVILVKSWTSQPWTLPLDTFYIAKYPKIVQFSSVIPFWKAIKLLIPEFLFVLEYFDRRSFYRPLNKKATFFFAHPLSKACYQQGYTAVNLGLRT